MDDRSRFLALAAGLYCLIAGALVILRPGFYRAAAERVARDPGLLLMAGLLTLGLGLAWVLGHQRWQGGAVVVAVTLLGWLILAKGLVRLAVPAERLERIFAAALARPAWNGLATLVLGLWLVWATLRQG